MLKPLLAATILLIGCSDDAPKTARKAPADRRAQAEVVLSRTPEARTYSIQGNQLQVILVPVADSAGFVEMQRCYVWRDVEFKTASIQCPAESSDVPLQVGGSTTETPHP